MPADDVNHLTAGVITQAFKGDLTQILAVRGVLTAYDFTEDKINYSQDELALAKGALDAIRYIIRNSK